LAQIGEQARRMDDGRFRLERIVQPAIGGGRRHELGNALRPLRADRARIEPALFPDQPDEGHRRQPTRLGLLLHEGAHDIDERLWPGEGKSGLLDPSLDTRERTHLATRCRGRDQAERRKETDCR